MASGSPSWIDLLVFGFIHENERKHLFDIPSAIILIIINFYPAIYKFGLHDEDRWELSEDKLLVKTKRSSCSGFMIYADLNEKDDIGLNSGIHYWSVKIVRHGYNNCYRSMGVTTMKDKKLIHESSGDFISARNGSYNMRYAEGYHYYFDAVYIWQRNVVFTIKLDCDNWTVTYYMDSAKRRMDQIVPEQYYFPAISICNIDTSLRVVETPQNIQ